MLSSGAVGRHAARFLLAPLVALVAYLAFPRAGSLLPHSSAVGSVAPTDVIAPVGFLVPKPEPQRVREAEALAATVRPVVTAHPEAAEAAAAQAGHFFAVLDSAAGVGASLVEAARAQGFAASSGDAAALGGAALRAELRRAVIGALRLSAAGYLPAGASTTELGPEVVVRRGADERVLPSDSLRAFGDFLERAAQQRPGQRPGGGEGLYVRLLGFFFRPTLVYERAETERRRDELRRSVDSVQAVVQPGEKIIGAHEVVDAAAAAKLAAYRAVIERGTTGRVRGAVTTIGELGLDTGLMVLFGVLCLFVRPHIYQDYRALAFFAVGFAVVTVAAGLLARFVPSRPELIPVAFAVILFSVLFDGRIAAVAAMVLAAFLGIQRPFAGSEALFITFVGGVAAALSVERIRRRSEVYYSIAIVTAVYAAAATVSGAAAGEQAISIARSAGLGGVNALASAALAMLALPLAERFTRSTTDLTLLELSDPDRPLLRRLAIEAPGTYAHSVAMANLCEAACNAIGANGLLARVGCYYHDVGKLKHPQYFAENQTHPRNPHDQLKPALSAAVIRRHVEDGLALAVEHRLPRAIQAFIPEHHGTTAISYFLERARAEEPAAQAREELFRYPGPRPRSAETAVALLGDAVEAALRVLDDPAPETVADAIEHLVETRVGDGQLKEAPLTLAQIEIVKGEFRRVYGAMSHSRVEYPEDAGGITADWEVDHRG
ncbi:MAG: HDIG domain-containing metalloprotein [Gemmatimonadales bacterium]|jgi:putative nucleotidyltransferase with HDIG domain